MSSTCKVLNVIKLANNLLQEYIKSLIRFSLTRSKLLTFLNRARSICGWTILSLISKMGLLKYDI